MLEYALLSTIKTENSCKVFIKIYFEDDLKTNRFLKREKMVNSEKILKKRKDKTLIENKKRLLNN